MGNVLARVRKRQAMKISAMPLWLGSDDNQLIEDIYSTARDMRERGINIQVDHSVPLQNHNVCGLHVPWNLQIMAASQNRAKSNKHV